MPSECTSGDYIEHIENFFNSTVLLKRRGGPREEEIIIHAAQRLFKTAYYFGKPLCWKKKLGYEDKQIVAWQATIWNAYYFVMPLCGMWMGLGESDNCDLFDVAHIFSFHKAQINICAVT